MRDPETLRNQTLQLLASGVSSHVFPGASACIMWRDRPGELHSIEVAHGKLSEQGAEVTPQTFYDLASLTKPFIAMLALRLVQQGKLHLDAEVGAILSDLRTTPAATILVESLFTHRGSLRAWGALFLDVPSPVGSASARRWMIHEAARRLERNPEGQAVYSDLGYMLAGEVVARAAKAPLPQVLERELLKPLGLQGKIFYPAALHSHERTTFSGFVAPTELCAWRNRLIQSEVHDENCAAMGGISGHAGLFGTAGAVASVGQAVLDCLQGKSDFIDAKLLQRALLPRPGGTFRFGWDGKSPKSSSAGSRMSESAFGHLGFTGTSIWCDPVRSVVIVLLSNRICPTRLNEKIKAFRPAFHDGIVATLDEIES